MPEPITHHLIDGVETFNDFVRAEPLSDPDANGSCSKYRFFVKTQAGWEKLFDLPFQKGPLREKLVDGSLRTNIPNGVSSELLLGVLIHHFEGFQKGPFACDENAEALKGFRAALKALKKRTKARAAQFAAGEMKS